MKTTTARLPIGQVTGGGFNYLQGKPAGACFVIGSRFDKSALTQQEFFNRKHKKPELQRYESKNRGLVLIRNPRSFDYHLAFLY